MSFNKIIVLGNLTKGPELRYTAKGTPVCTLNVAENARERDSKTNEPVEHVIYYKATAWGKPAETIAQHFERGSEIYLEGRFRPEVWTDKDGKERVTFGIQVTDFNFTGGSNRNNSGRAATAATNTSKGRATDGSSRAVNSTAHLDDDIEF